MKYGEGPGEYELLSFLQAAGDRLYTFDFASSRLTVLDLVGRVATSETIWVFAADGDVVAVMRNNDLGVETVERRP